jgi:hypothetical protein
MKQIIYLIATATIFMTACSSSSEQKQAEPSVAPSSNSDAVKTESSSNQAALLSFPDSTTQHIIIYTKQSYSFINQGRYEIWKLEQRGNYQYSICVNERCDNKFENNPFITNGKNGDNIAVYLAENHDVPYQVPIKQEGIEQQNLMEWNHNNFHLKCRIVRIQ